MHVDSWRAGDSISWKRKRKEIRDPSSLSYREPILRIVICSVTLKRWYHSVDNVWLNLLINSCFQQFNSSFMTKINHSLSLRTRMMYVTLKQKRFSQ